MSLEPIAQTRPAFDLLSGITTIFEKQRRAFRSRALAALVRPTLSRVTSADYPHVAVNESDWLLRGPTIMANARWLPPRRFSLPETTEGSFIAMVEDEIAYAWLSPSDLAPCTPHTINECLEMWKKSIPQIPAGGKLVRYPWDLVEGNADEIANDFACIPHDDHAGRPSTLTLVGSSDLLRVDPTARIDPFVIADTTAGPVIIGRDAVVSSFTRLEGPCYIGPRTEVFAAAIRSGTSLGPNCRVGGEVLASIILGNSNKAHEGYLGHSYLGEWVKLGAGTHVSDLRNDHAPIGVMLAGKRVESDLMRVGAYVGDHVKTGVGCRMNAGSHLGPFSQLLPCGSLLPKYVPAFCAVDYGRLIDCHDPQPLFEAAERVMAKRGEEFSDYHRALYKSLFDRNTDQRRLSIHESELRRLRRAI